MKTQTIPNRYGSLTPYITVRGAEDAIKFYKKVFGAKEVGRITMADGTIGHCEVEIGDSKFKPYRPIQTQMDNSDPY